MIFAGKCHSQNCWPERVGFSKLSLMRILQAGKTSFTRLCPVLLIAWIPFISFDIQSSRFHSKHISSSKILRTTHYKHCVYVFSVFADTGFSLPALQPQQRRNFWPQVHLCRIPRDPRWLTHAAYCQSIKKKKFVFQLFLLITGTSHLPPQR